MGDFLSGLGSSISSGIGSLLGGGSNVLGTGTGTIGPNTAGNDPNSIFNTGTSPISDLFGSIDPTGSTGAVYSLGDTSGTPSNLGYTDPNAPQGVPAAAQQAPDVPGGASYTPAPGQPSLPAPDPSSWQPGGTPISPGPTGFAPTGMPSWLQGAAMRLPTAPPGMTQPNYPSPASPDEAQWIGRGGQQPTAQATDPSTGELIGMPSSGVAAKDVPAGTVVPPTADNQGGVIGAGGQGQGKTGDTAATGKPGETAQDDTEQPPAATPPAAAPRAAAPQMPPQIAAMLGNSPLGRLAQSLQGAMSGNPQSMMQLIPQIMGMMMGGRGMMPGMMGGGVAPNGMPLSSIPWAQGYNPQTGQWSSPQARQQALAQVQAQQVRGGQASINPVTGRPYNPARAGDRLNTGPQATGEAPSRLPNGQMPRGPQQVAPIVSNSLRAGGLPDNAIQGIMMNVSLESGWNPGNVTPGDQWKWAVKHPNAPADARDAHGLWQEGADEWMKYISWLKNRGGGDWRDPKLQSDFLVQNLQNNYPNLWRRLQNAQSPQEAARLFARDYLKPGDLGQRYARIDRGM